MGAATARRQWWVVVHLMLLTPAAFPPLQGSRAGLRRGEACSFSLRRRFYLPVSQNVTSYSRFNRSVKKSQRPSRSALLGTGPASTPNASREFHGLRQ